MTLQLTNIGSIVLWNFLVSVNETQVEFKLVHGPGARQMLMTP